MKNVSDDVAIWSKKILRILENISSVNFDKKMDLHMGLLIVFCMSASVEGRKFL